MDHAGRARNALPWAETLSDPITLLVFDKHIEVPLKDEEHLLDLVRMSGISLAGRHEHDREREVLCRDHRGVAVFARTACTNEAVLRSFKPLNLRVFEGGPIGLPI